MNPARKAKLQKQGFRVTDAKEFLGLSDEEITLIDMKVALVRRLKALRAKKGVTQAQLAKLLGSSKPRVTMIEREHRSGSLDLICRALFVLGASRKELGRAISRDAA